MLENLLESRAPSRRNIGGQMFSLALHVSAIAVAIFATERVVKAAPAPVNERIEFATPAPPPPAAVIDRPRTAAAVAPATFGHQILIAPITIPDVLPAIDLSRPITDDRVYEGGGVAGGLSGGDRGAGGVRSGVEATYLAMQVEKIAALIEGTGTPEYPASLRAAGITGEVRIQFVVDTTGRAELGTLKILKATSPLFGDAVRRALPKMRFKPAEAGSRKVRQIVEMPFDFSIRQ